MSDAIRNRGYLLLGQRRYPEAEAEFGRALAVDPEDYMAGAGLALALTHTNKHRRALEQIRQALAGLPFLAYLHYVHAIVLNNMDRDSEALQAAREAIRLDPEDADYYGMEAIILAGMQKWQAALDAANQGLRITPDDVDCINVRAMALTHLGRQDEAADAIRHALSEQPENDVTHANLGWAHLHAGEYAAALDSFREALRLDPNSEWARRGMVEALKARNRVYSLMLRFYLWMMRLGSYGSWGVALGFLAASIALTTTAKSHPDYAWLLSPLNIALLLFCVLSWNANHAFNLYLYLHPSGRHVLMPEQKKECLLYGIGLFFFLGMLGLYTCIGALKGFHTVMMLVLLMVPVISTCDANPGRARLVMFGIWAVLWGAFALSVLLPLGMLWTGHDPRPYLPFCQSARSLYYYGSIACLWGGNIINTKLS